MCSSDLAGYSFKKFRLASAKESKSEEGQFVPMLIGRSVTVRPLPPEEDPLAWAHNLMPWFVGGILATLALVAGMVIWFRRGDRRVRRRLEAVRQGGFVEPAPDPVPLARPIRPENN